MQGSAHSDSFDSESVVVVEMFVVVGDGVGGMQGSAHKEVVVGGLVVGVVGGEVVGVKVVVVEVYVVVGVGVGFGVGVVAGGGVCDTFRRESTWP